MTDYPDFQVPQAHATAISATGVPLLTAAATIISERLQAIPAAGSATYGPVSINQIGWALNVGAQFPAAATVPFVEVELRWLEPVSATLYGDDHYFMPGSSGGPAFTTLAQGFSKSTEILVKVTNLDPAQVATVSTFFAQDSVARTSDHWRWFNQADNGLTVPTFTLAQLPDDEDVLGILHNLTVPASGSLTVLCGMAPGRTAQLAGTVGTISPSSLQFQVLARPASVYTTAGNLLLTTPAAATWGYQFLMPRGPVSLTITNSSTTAGSIFAMMTAAE